MYLVSLFRDRALRRRSESFNAGEALDDFFGLLGVFLGLGTANFLAAALGALASLGSLADDDFCAGLALFAAGGATWSSMDFLF